MGRWQPSDQQVMSGPVVESAPAVEPAALDFSQLHRAGRPGWWRAAVGVALVVAASLIVVPIVVTPVFVLALVLTGSSASAALDSISDLSHVTPVLLAYVNVVLALGIGVVMLVTRALHGLRPRWVSSVAPRLRWGYLVACLGAALVTMCVVVVLSAFIPAAANEAGWDGKINDFTTQSRNFLLVIALLTPLQAAGEEYVYRGYLTQAFGGIFAGSAGRAVAVLGPALIFALAHGQQDLPIFFDRFAFGLIAGVLVLRTGGLEAGIAMHVINNWVALGLGVMFGDMNATLQPTGGSWATIAVTVVQSLLYLALALKIAQRMGLSRTVSAELVGPVRPVYRSSSAL